MKKITLYHALVALLFLSLACAESNDALPEIPEEEEVINFIDTASIRSVALNLLDYIPTWEELERFTDGAQRLPIPAYEKRALAWIPPGGDTNIFEGEHMKNVLNFNAEIIEFYQGNLSSALIAPLPPFFMPDGSGITYPMPEDILDRKLRAVAVSFLYEKSLGLPVTLVNFYPPHQDTELFETRAEFETWFANRFLPEKVAEAKAAEIIKAEKMIPWPSELEIFAKNLGGIGDGGFMEDSSEDEMLAFATEIKDRVLAAIRPHFNGKIIAHLYNNYHNRPETHFWDRMDYTGFDELHLAFFPQYNAEATGPYMDSQIEHYTKIIQNSGNIPWIASEISVFEWYVEEGKLEEHEKGMYEVVFSKLEAAPIPPKGISPAGGYMKSEEARTYVKSYFATH